MSSNDKYWQTIVGVIVGGALSFFSSIGLWKTQSSHDYDNSVKSKREELIVEAADIFARAGRVKGLLHGHLLQVAAANTVSSLCISLQMRGEKSNECDKEIDYTIMNDFNKEIFEYNAKFMKLKSLVSLYFCRDTKKEFTNIEVKVGWWDITPEQSEKILATMHTEYECNL